jgi:transposase-like protein
MSNQTGQHFLLSTAARTLSLAKVMRMSDDVAFNTFKAIRWASTEGDPVCPRCGCIEIYNLSDNRRFKCAACLHKFSVTSGTIFASRKLAIRDLLAAIAIFVNGAKGYAALHLSRDLDVQYKTAFVLLHKLREALGAVQSGQTLDGEVEVDGAYFGGYVKPENRKADRRDRRLAMNQTGKRRVVVIMRERGGQSLPFVTTSEAASVGRIGDVVAPGSTVYADEAASWDALHAKFLTKRINHSVEYANGEISTNWAESFFSRIRRAEVGVHHHIAGRYLQAYANEMSWREDNRRVSNGEQYLMVTGAALAHPVSRQWKGYWQRAA